MENSQLSHFLESERQKTDDSLIAERDKTNESIAEAKKKAEDLTDEVVKEERVEADQAASTSRVEADTHHDVGRETLAERRRADKMIKKERRAVDSALEQEREFKKDLTSHLLEQEREKTDENLQVERNHTDLEVHQASSLLSDEIAQHAKTKITLTTRDEFLAIVSHDLRNPIGAIFSCAEMLLDSAYKEGDSERKHGIELIKRNADSALRLIADLLDMERIAEGRLQLQLKRHSLGTILQEAIESLVPVASAKNVTLRVGDSNMPGDVVCDRDRIMQVLSNLIGNAVKFVPTGESVVLNLSFNGTEAQVSVCDTGPGIPEDKKDTIFNRFAQLDVKDRVGLGLGLYISKMLIQAHRGRIWVESKIGEGSTFFFTLPRQRP